MLFNCLENRIGCLSQLSNIAIKKLLLPFLKCEKNSLVIGTGCFDYEMNVLAMTNWRIHDSLILVQNSYMNTVLTPLEPCLCSNYLMKNTYRIYSRISREILDRFWRIFFSFDLYAGQYLVLCSTQVKTKNVLLKVHFDLYAGRLIREYIRYSPK